MTALQYEHELTGVPVQFFMHESCSSFLHVVRYVPCNTKRNPKVAFVPWEDIANYLIGSYIDASSAERRSACVHPPGKARESFSYRTVLRACTRKNASFV
jgi:hypothetical protein